MTVHTHSHVSPPSFGNSRFDNEVRHGISWQRTGDIAYRQATAQLIIDFIKDNILEPESDMPLDEERLIDHLGFLTGWIIGSFCRAASTGLISELCARFERSLFASSGILLWETIGRPLLVAFKVNRCDKSTRKYCCIRWEYFMPKRPERMALYIRESDPRLANSVTIESQAKLVREYGEKEGYIYNPDLEFREAISAYDVPYTERIELLRMLDAARRKLFDVLVVAEVRAIGRRQVEVLVIYDMLLKYGVRLETVKEKFGEDAMSKEILASQSLFAEIEVEQSKMRMMRGRTDRVVIGQAPNGGTCVYTHRLVDTETEVSGRYELNDEVVYTDTEGKQWTRVDVALFFCSLLAQGGSLAKAAQTLNAMGVPSAKGKHWTPETIRRIVSNPILYGQPYANRYKQLALGRSKNGRQVGRETMRPVEEWIPLPACPAIISKTTFEEIQMQIQRNKAERLRTDERIDQVGLLRAGYIFCGICGRKMYISHPSKSSIRNRKTSPYYLCRRSTGGETGIVYNHRTQISLHYIERVVKEKIRQALLEPDLICTRVEEIRSHQRPTIDATSIEATIARIDKSIRDLDKLAEQATTDDLAAGLAQQVNRLERQKSEATTMLHGVVEIEEQRMETEMELRKFEQWAEKVRPFLTDAECLKTATYDELRLAVQILGIRVSVYPTQGQWEYRYRIEAADSAGNSLKAQ